MNHVLFRTLGLIDLHSVTVCNGHAELCNRSYSNITFPGAHDSFAFSDDPLDLPRAQEVDIPTQLGLGIRLLQAQSHMGLDGLLHFCHTSEFLYDGGTVQAYLELVATFLDNNPNEVLTLLFTNPEGLSFVDVWAPVFEAAGVIKWAFVPTQSPISYNKWPTLGQMIANNQRLVVFIDYVGTDGSTVNYLIPEFDSMWETPYDATNATFPCSIDRIRGTLPASSQLYLINHYLDIGVGSVTFDDWIDASTTNAVPSIIANANECAPLGSGRYANVVLMDFVNIGDWMPAINQLNGLT
ncbi:PLC-like phosphodiesterase [Lactarius quietus]|nr:PLC-like phosphodiesterase [Lactarius quietus]